MTQYTTVPGSRTGGRRTEGLRTLGRRTLVRKTFGRNLAELIRQTDTWPKLDNLSMLVPNRV